MQQSDGPILHRFGQLLRERIDYLIVGAFATTFLVASVRRGLGLLTAPGPGFWPAVVSAGLLGIAVVKIIWPGSTEGQEPFTRNALRVALATASIAGFVVAFTRWGMLLPGFVLLVGWLRVFGERSWWQAALIAAVSVGAVYGILGTWLKIPLPDDAVASLWNG